jgi:small membrane protein
MSIRIILIALLAVLLVGFLRQRSPTRAQALNKIGGLALFSVAIFAILFPDSTNTIAHAVGVGRGADLLLYTLTVAFLLLLLIQYMHRREDQDRLVQLARRIALIEARQDSHNKKISSMLSLKKASKH